MNPKTDVLLVAVTKVEGKAIISVFQNATDQEPKPIEISKQIYYDLGIVNENRVFLVRSEMGAGGVGASQQTVQKGILALSPTAVIMVGIAFGTNEKKQNIGDVLVSKQLMLYDLQKISTKDGKPQIIPRGDRPSASLRLIKYFRNAELFWDESKFKVNFGLILSGEKLVDNIDFRQQLLDLEPEAIGGEMEGSGLYVACQDPTVDWVLVKSICDWADGNKAQDKEERQQLAAENAANFVLYMLQKLPTLQNMLFNDDFNKEPPENEDVKRPFSRVANQIVTNLNGLSVDIDERNKIIENIVKENEEISSCLKEEDLCRSFAMKMLNLGLFKSLPFLKDLCSHNIIPHNLKLIFDLLAPSWVDFHAATCVSKCALHREKPAIFLNSSNFHSAKMYILHASNCSPHIWYPKPNKPYVYDFTCIVYGVNPIDDVVKQIEEVLISELGLDECINKQEALNSMLISLNEGETPVFLVFNYSKSIASLLPKLQNTFPLVTFFLLTGENFPDEKELKDLRFKFLEPPLEPNAEKKAIADIRIVYNNLRQCI